MSARSTPLLRAPWHGPTCPPPSALERRVEELDSELHAVAQHATFEREELEHNLERAIERLEASLAEVREVVGLPPLVSSARKNPIKEPKALLWHTIVRALGSKGGDMLMCQKRGDTHPNHKIAFSVTFKNQPPNECAVKSSKSKNPTEDTDQAVNNIIGLICAAVRAFRSPVEGSGQMVFEFELPGTGRSTNCGEANTNFFTDDRTPLKTTNFDSLITDDNLDTFLTRLDQVPFSRNLAHGDV